MTDTLDHLSPVFESISGPELCERLDSQGYWPAIARRQLDAGRHAASIETCRRNIDQEPDLLSGRLVYALTLHATGQLDSATEQFFYVLSRDPENLAALKYLGDIKFAAGDELAAMSYYRRVLEIDPRCRGLVCGVRSRPGETTRTITISRPAEQADKKHSLAERPTVPFYTETIGDLYLAQGHPRLAADVFRHLAEETDRPRVREKLERAERLLSKKER